MQFLLKKKEKLFICLIFEGWSQNTPYMVNSDLTRFFFILLVKFGSELIFFFNFLDSIIFQCN